jgi:translocation protein SEC63
VKNGCTCTACLQQRARIKKRENGAAFLPHIGLKCASTRDSAARLLTAYPIRHVSVVGGWALFAYIAYKVANSSGGGSIYNPFEILGLSEVRASSIRRGV